MPWWGWGFDCILKAAESPGEFLGNAVPEIICILANASNWQHSWVAKKEETDSQKLTSDLVKDWGS